jgi:hypothetical protein
VEFLLKMNPKKVVEAILVYGKRPLALLDLEVGLSDPLEMDWIVLYRVE